MQPADHEMFTAGSGSADGPNCRARDPDPRWPDARTANKVIARTCDITEATVKVQHEIDPGERSRSQTGPRQPFGRWSTAVSYGSLDQERHADAISARAPPCAGLFFCNGAFVSWRRCSRRGHPQQRSPSGSVFALAQAMRVLRRSRWTAPEGYHLRAALRHLSGLAD